MTPEAATLQVGDSVAWLYDCAGNIAELREAVVTATKRAEYSHMIKGVDFHVWVRRSELA